MAMPLSFQVDLGPGTPLAGNTFNRPSSKLAGSAKEFPQTPFCLLPRGVAVRCQVGSETNHDACLGPAKWALVEGEQCPENFIAKPSRSLVPVVNNSSLGLVANLAYCDVRVGEVQASAPLALDDPASAGNPGLGRERRRYSRGVISDAHVNVDPGFATEASIEVPAMKRLSNPYAQQIDPINRSIQSLRRKTCEHGAARALKPHDG